MPIFDTHAHYDADRFDSDRDALLSAMPGVGVGLVLDPGARGQHLGSRVLELTRDYLLDNYPVVRIEADTDVENVAAQKALERCGFSAEGVLRKYRFHHGRYHDSYLYSYLRDEKF